jgi:uncharacterized protein DUF6719
MTRALPIRGPHMAAWPALLGTVLLITAAASPTRAQHVGREQDITDLRLGQRVMVDDGTCPAGQVKEVSGAKMTPDGIARAVKCVPRFGPKKK